MNICAVIIAGGSGTRLWPLSRASYPKQFLKLYGDKTMLQDTLGRLSGLDLKSNITICNEDHRFLVAEQLREIGNLGTIILEPIGRNTAPAICLAALSTKDDPLLLVLPADHIITDIVAFEESILNAVPLANDGKLVTFGIVPSEPHTGYGYIKRGKKDGLSFEVDQFIEKPKINDAKKYFESDNYFWNSGMFLFKSSRFIEELERFCPDIYTACKEAVGVQKKDLDFVRIGETAFTNCPSKSIDYAVLEKADNVNVVPMDAGWSDIGSWSSLWEHSEKDLNGNVIKGDVIVNNSRNNLIRSDDRLVTALGVENLIVVSTKDVLMVANKDEVQNIKSIVQYLKESSRDEWKIHREVYRPWGKYDSVDFGSRYQVKRITVNPGAKLSVQKHHHRSEHWVVVSGIAKVTKNDKTFLISENESTYIPVATVHALENPGKVFLELIEVQSGSYLGEDDIVRIEDRYGR